MRFESPLICGTLVRRYQRFLADVQLPDGRVVTAHCPNTGSMLGCKEPGSPVWISQADNPARKLAFTWELVQALPDVLVGINTARSNRLVREAIETGVIRELQGYDQVRAEVRFGIENSRIDLLLEETGRPPCYVEVKNVTAAVGEKVALFPDAVSARGAKHLRELMAMVEQGKRAVLVFCVQRDDVTQVRPADEIDPLYGRTLRAALEAGVEVLAYGARVDPGGIELVVPLTVFCP
jgi:sugar fermentation stimulation protein A